MKTPKKTTISKKRTTDNASEIKNHTQSGSEIKIPDRYFIATLAALIIKENDEPRRAVVRAWELIKEADELLKGKISKDIEEQKELHARLKKPEEIKSAIQQITSEERDFRAQVKFERFWKGDCSPSGTGLNKQLEWLKPLERYKEEGFTASQVKELKALYQKAFPTHKKKSSKSPCSHSREGDYTTPRRNLKI